MTDSALIEISDIRIRATESGQEIYSEPGMALLAADRAPVLGQLAQQSLRLQPTRIHSRFWSDLSSDPIQISNTSVRHSADLVWHQLDQIKSKSSAQKLSICVPSNMSQPQMQLLTGICQSLSLEVDYLVDLGLAQLSGCGCNTNVSHIDLQLHQLVISRYSASDQSLELKNQEVVQGVGFIRLIDRLLHLLSDKFIQSSRFDPLHSGDTEQQLFNQVIDMIESGSQMPLHMVPFHIETAQKSHKIELSGQELTEVIASFTAELCSRIPDSEKRAYAPVFSQLPGFQVAESDIQLSRENTLTGASQLLAQQPKSAEIGYITSSHVGVQVAQKPSVAETESTAVAKASDATANGLLYKGYVYTEQTLDALYQAGFPADQLSFVDTELKTSTEQISVNGAVPARDQTLMPGDQIKMYGGRIDAVAVRLAH